MIRRSFRPFAVVVVLSVLFSSIVAPITADGDHDRDGRSSRYVDIQILGLNDFHGQLEVVTPIASSAGRIGALTVHRPTSPDRACRRRPTVHPGRWRRVSGDPRRNLRADEPENTCSSPPAT